MHVRFASPESVKADLFACEIDFGANESMRPKGINEVAMAEQFNFATIIGATQKGNRSLERELKVERPVIRKGSSRRSRVEAWCCTMARSIDKSPGAVGQGQEVRMLKASPDFVLPSSVVALDGGLKAGLSRGCEDRGDIELETKADHTPERIGPLMGALEEGVVIELGVIRKSVFSPVRDERFDREFGGPGGFDPTGAESAVQADSVENHDIGSAANDEPFHEVEAVEFGLTGCDARQIPPLGRWRAPNSPAAIQRPSSQQNSTDGANGGDSLCATFFEGSMNRCRAELSEVAGLLELLAEPENEILEPETCGVSRSSSAARRIRPVHAIKSLAVRPSNPVLNRRKTHAKFPLDFPQRPSSSNLGDHRPSPLLNAVFRSHSVLVRK